MYIMYHREGESLYAWTVFGGGTHPPFATKKGGRTGRTALFPWQRNVWWGVSGGIASLFVVSKFKIQMLLLHMCTVTMHAQHTYIHKHTPSLSKLRAQSWEKGLQAYRLSTLSLPLLSLSVSLSLAPSNQQITFSPSIPLLSPTTNMHHPLLLLQWP